MTRNLIVLIITFWTIQSTAQTKDRYDRIVDSLQRNGQSEKLIPFFLQELKSKPKNEAVLRWLGYLYIADGKPVVGEKYYREAIAVNPKCARCYMNIAKIYANKNDYKKAFELIEKSITVDTSDAALYLVRAKLKGATGDKSGALADYDKAIEKDPKNVDCYLDRADFNAAQAYFYPALADINKAIELVPAHYYPYFKRSNLYYDNHMFKEAMEDINKAIQLDSTQYSLYIGRGCIYSVGKEHTRAIEDYDKAIALNPNDYFAFYNRSLEKYALEDMNGACADIFESYSLIKKADPANPLKGELEYSITTYCDSTKAGYYYQRGIAYYNLGQFDKAIAVYSKGLEKFPNNSMTLSFRGNAYFMLRDYPHALDDYDLSIKNKANVIDDIRINQKHTQLTGDSISNYVNGFLASMYISIAEARFVMQQYEEALTAINKGIELAPDLKEFGKENYYNVRGNIFLGQGKYQQAMNDFDKCIRMNTSFALAYVNRAIVKMNIADQVKITSYSISGGINNQGFNANWTLPLKNTSKKSDTNIMSALNDCNKAITLEPAMGFAYYIRGHIKRSLNYTGDYCVDLIKAKDLGYNVEAELMKECGK